ncbi:hypothetical protein SEA_HIBISCUS_55 [Gordonia phage Hibiscus]
MITTGSKCPRGRVDIVDNVDAVDSNETVTVTERSQARIATVMREIAGHIGCLEYLTKIAFAYTRGFRFGAAWTCPRVHARANVHAEMSTR